ncbi:hypothetical protein D3C85_1288810 [compost metagenome]
MNDAIIPCKAATKINGCLMKFLVAPTNCILLIKKRCENIAKRMVLLINAIAMTNKIPAKPNTIKLMVLMFLFTMSINELW